MRTPAAVISYINAPRRRRRHHFNNAPSIVLPWSSAGEVLIKSSLLMSSLESKFQLDTFITQLDSLWFLTDEKWSDYVLWISNNVKEWKILSSIFSFILSPWLANGMSHILTHNQCFVGKYLKEHFIACTITHHLFYASETQIHLMHMSNLS